jgi:hypothetical protein
VLAAQDVLNEIGWPILELSSTLIVAQGPPLMGIQMYNLPKISIKLVDGGDSTRIDTSVSMVGPLVGPRKKQFVGLIGRFTNAVSLRIQTESIAINPTVALGQGQGPGTAPPQTPTHRDKAQQLMDLKALLDCGALTAEEFEAEKSRVLKSF